MGHAERTVLRSRIAKAPNAIVFAGTAAADFAADTAEIAVEAGAVELVAAVETAAGNPEPPWQPWQPVPAADEAELRPDPRLQSQGPKHPN